MCEHNDLVLKMREINDTDAVYYCNDCHLYLHKPIDYVLSCSNNDVQEYLDNGFTRKQAKFLVWKYYKDRGFNLDLTIL